MKNISKEKNKQKKVSMKEAFEKISPKKVRKSINEKKSGIRYIWWKYPSFFEKFIKNSRPLSYILMFSIVSIFLCYSLINLDIFKDFNNKQKDSFVEGSVGAISSLNPLYLTQNPIDKAIHELVFEKFIEIDKDGNPIKGVADTWDMSDDYLRYSFNIEDGHFWQDGEPLTMDDVIFTFNTAIKLAEKYNADSVGVPLVGVKIQKVDEDTIEFVLENTNATFFEAVSIYIVPKHRLEDVSLNTMQFDIFTKYPLGSGPYSIVKSEPNIVIMEASEYFPEDIPIQSFTYRIYDDLNSLEVAFRNGELDAISGVNSGGLDFVNEYSDYKVLSTSIEQRTRIIFFNNRRDSLSNPSVRQALSYITDKESLLEKSQIPGEVAKGVFPRVSWAFDADAEQYEYNPESAVALFKEVGYEKNESSGYYEGEDNKILSFTLSYLDNDSNGRLVESLRELWKEEGVILNLDPLSYEQITQEIISTRNFEMLLYEVETTVDPDQYNLWHSLKKDYPDLNLSGYEYERVDILLEEARTEHDKEVRKEKYRLFQKYLMDDAPVIFLYHPQYVYVVPKDLQGPNLDEIAYPQDRFRNITKWSL